MKEDPIGTDDLPCEPPVRGNLIIWVCVGLGVAVLLAAMSLMGYAAPVGGILLWLVRMVVMFIAPGVVIGLLGRRVWHQLTGDPLPRATYRARLLGIVIMCVALLFWLVLVLS